MSTIEARREPVLGGDRKRPAGTPDDRLGPIAGARGENPGLGPLGSFGLHLAVVLVLLFHPPLPGGPPPELPPIPVSLVVEPPAPKPPKPPAPKPKPPPGRLASVEMGPTTAAKPAPRPGPPAGGAPPELEAAGLPLPPPPPPLAAPTQESFALPPPSKARPRPHPAALEGRQAKYPGPSATRDEYLAYLAMLTRRHTPLLTPQLLAGRRGQTVLAVLVLDNGTIARLTVVQSSGYPDIDRKVEEIVRAVGRFPPLPQYVQGPSWELQFIFPFPDSLGE